MVVDDAPIVPVPASPAPISPAPVPEQAPQAVVVQETKEGIVAPSQVIITPAPQTVTAPQILPPTDTIVSPATVAPISSSVVSSPDQTL